MTTQIELEVRPALARRLFAEFLGTGLLVAAIVGSGIAASQLSNGQVGLELLENAIATAAVLFVLIATLGSVSGAHFNPLVSILDVWLGHFRPREVAPYGIAQIAGAVGGAILANLMFGLSAVSWSTNDRATGPHLLAEVVATAGLMLVIFGLTRGGHHSLVAPAVAAYIAGAYWFTSSTSFANPAVTIGRMFSDSFAGIAPSSVLPFIGAQIIGAGIGLAIVLALWPNRHPVQPSGVTV